MATGSVPEAEDAIMPEVEADPRGKSVSSAESIEYSHVEMPSARDEDEGSPRPQYVLHSPLSSTSMTFDGILSPRPQPNGKRYLGGYLQHRGKIAGGWLKTWKRKYFRLREHGLVCYQQQDDATPLFVLQFQATTRLQVDRGIFGSSSSSSSSQIHPHSRHSVTSKDTGKTGATISDQAPHESVVQSPQSAARNLAASSSASLLFVLCDVAVEGRQVSATKVETPVYLRAENETQFDAWIENLRVQLESWRRMVVPVDIVHRVLEDRTDPHVQHGIDTNSETGCVPVQHSLEHCEFSGIWSESMLVFSSDESACSVVAKDSTSAITSMCSLGAAEMLASQKPVDRFDTNYLLMKEIGEGSFSIVHRALNRFTGAMYAVKCCRSSSSLDEEVRLLRKLAHPNVISLEAVYHDNENAYVVTDFMQDGDLCERLLQRQHLQEDEARNVTIQVLQGLEYLHRHHIMHRDVKPENILLHGNLVKLADFGLAKQLPTPTSLLTRSCGTLEYAAPELLCGRPYGLKSDIFSLGIVLYVLLFGAFPFSIESAAALQRREQFADGIDVRDMTCLRPESPQWLHVSPQAQDVLLRMLCVDEHERVTATALLQHPWFHLKVSSFPIMFSLKSVNEEEQQRRRSCLEQGVRELLSRGVQVVKYNQNGTATPHATKLTVDAVHKTISWTRRNGILRSSEPLTSPSRSKFGRRRELNMADVKEIRSGCTTSAFKALNSTAAASKKKTCEGCCLSIVTTSRTLDLVAATREQRDMIVQGVARMLPSKPNCTK